MEAALQVIRSRASLSCMQFFMELCSKLQCT